MDKSDRFKRMTNQRLVILEFLEDNDKHLTADQIYLKIRSKLPKISKATVYRNLNGLHKEGMVDKLDIGDGKTRWETAGKPHHHFVCNKCGRIIEINLADIWQVKDRVESKYDLEVDDYQLILRGKCDFCLKH